MTQARGVAIPTSSRWFFWVWVVSLLCLGTIVHYGFERPALSWLRQRWSPRPAPLVVAAAAE